MIKILPLILILLCSGVSFAEDIDENPPHITEEMKAKIYRLERAMDALAEDPDNPELLYEKAVAMLESLGPMFSLRTATNALLRAIELDPDNEKYKAYLGQVYDSFWNPADYSVSEKDLKQTPPGELQNLNELQAIKDRVKNLVAK
ncbi:MAG: hypothetical protein P9L93_02875 [Candidatus Gorgyraea atricola]|nr:hypothetical protein [Candidatus Gorgyraea atricola]